MSFSDKYILCPDCGHDFTFTAEKQGFYSSKDFTNDPERCPRCLQSKKQQRTGVHIASGTATAAGSNSVENTS